MLSLPLKPILRKPRSQWRIPSLSRESKRQPPDKLNALITGTTPLAREILRKLLFGLQQRLVANEESLVELVESLEAQLKTFWVLQPEFTLLLSRLWGGEYQVWLEVTPRHLAILLVLGLTVFRRTRLA